MSSGTASCINNSGVANAATGVCDGNGDGQLTGNDVMPSVYTEMFLFWQHLAKAGLIEGSYSGVSGPVIGTEAIIGTNSPASRVPNTGWGTDSTMSPYGNYLIYGAKDGLAYIYTGGPALIPEDAWNIDTKMDDGKPGTGTVVALYMTYYGCASAGTMDYATVTYVLTQKAKACSFIFRHSLD